MRGQEDRRDRKRDKRTGEGQKRPEEGQEDRRRTGKTGRGTRGQERPEMGQKDRREKDRRYRKRDKRMCG
jgi:hypothetical protein